MHEVGLTNTSKLDKVSNPQAFIPKGKGSSISKPQVDGSNDPSDIATCTLYYGQMSKWIDSNRNRKEWYDNH